MNKKTMIYGSIVVISIMVIVCIYFTVSLSKIKTYVAIVATSIPSTVPPVTPSVPLYQYVEVVDGCDYAFVGDCVNMRTGPGVEFPVVVKLRTGVVLKVSDTVIKDGKTWYKILFSHELLYPERVKGDWYVSAEYVKLFSNDGDHNLEKGEVATTTKHIVVDVSEQKLYAYQGDLLFMEVSVSTGLLLTPTDRGIFTIFKMTPSRFMQGPIPGVSNQVYDLPGVPWNLYFTAGGAVIHGAYWHNNFGRPWSHGCVNLTTEDAKKLYNWAEVGTKVKVQN
jgi:lipoprotein-anchoring transpeptidase ErfK/SrfK